MKEINPLINRIYKHYKGELYKVITCAFNESNQQKLVIYQSINYGTIWCRPLSEWTEEVIISSIELTDMNSNSIQGISPVNLKARRFELTQD